MRTIGIIGGLSWHSTAEYYRVIQEETAARRGGHASAPLLLESLDFDAVRSLQLAGDWDAAGAMLAAAGARLERAGADLVLIASNLMHRVAPVVEQAIDVPLLHIGDAVAAAAPDVQRLGVLGTRWTMEEPFYGERLRRYGIGTLVPDAATREEVDRAVFDELTQGIVSDATRALLVRSVAQLARDGAQAVVLACTELELAVGQDDTDVPLIDSMRVHARAAVEMALRPVAVSAGAAG